MTPSLEWWPTKAKEVPSPHRLPPWTPTQYKDTKSFTDRGNIF